MLDVNKARPMLEDGASYAEVAKTFSVARSTVSKHLPGFGWTHRQGGEYGFMVRKFNQEMRRKK